MPIKDGDSGSNVLDNKLLKVNKNIGLMILLSAFLFSLNSCSSKEKINVMSDYFKVFENFLEAAQITLFPAGI